MVVIAKVVGALLYLMGSEVHSPELWAFFRGTMWAMSRLPGLSTQMSLYAPYHPPVATWSVFQVVPKTRSA